MSAISEHLQSIQRFAASLKQEGVALDADDLADVFWLAGHLGSSSPVSPPPQSAKTTTVNPRRGQGIVAPPSPGEPKSPKVPVIPSPPETSTSTRLGLSAGVPLQVPAANALSAQLELSRALYPLMQQIPSPTQKILAEEATAIQYVEQEVWSPVLVAAPERRFDLAIVVEDIPSLAIWEDALTELQALVERLGAFRQIQTWRLRGERGRPLEIGLSWKSPRSFRQARALNDPTQRQLLWLVSDCTSDLWDRPQIYEALQAWGQYSPLAIVQLFPERLWQRTALGTGKPMRLRGVGSRATHRTLSAKATPMYPSFNGQGNPSKHQITLPIISLEPEPLRRWSQVVDGARDVSVAGVQIDFGGLGQQEKVSTESETLTAEQRVRWFCLTASITAQRLAGLMAAVPVTLSVVHLIQKTMLPQSRQVHVAEIFMGGLIESVTPSPGSSAQYRFMEGVREKLIEAVPISKTVRVLDTISAHISERLGKGAKSFPALVALIPQLPPDQKQFVEPFAEIGLGTLERLGGDYQVMAERLRQEVNLSPPELDSPEECPQWLSHKFTVAEVELEALQRFEFETAKIERSSRRQTREEWTITKSSGYGWQRIEQIADEIQLEMVEVLGGSFLMGSPKDEEGHRGSEEPQHEVTVSDFLIGKYPITQAQWRAVASLPQVDRKLKSEPSRFKGENRPVEQVNWDEAVEFCDRLSRHTNREYRLPTEAEWEYACRAGTTTSCYFGDTIKPELANYDESEKNETSPVGEYPANAFGLYDMHGNVWEWCLDHWHDSYEEKPEELKQNANIPWISDKESTRRTVRGGSWVNNPEFCRSAIRYYVIYSDSRDDAFGFRVLCFGARTL